MDLPVNNRFFAAIGLIVGLALTPSVSQAAAGSSADYEVEVLVFKNLMPELEGKEIWSPDRVDLALPDIDKAKKAASTEDEKSVIGKAAARLSEQKEYALLAHVRWTQPAEAKSTSPLMRIQTADGELDGTLVFYMSRFLHVDVKLLLKDIEASEKLAKASEDSLAEAANSARDVKTDAIKTEVMAAENTTLAYRIDESRRVRSDEINYFDHPKFGVLVKVTPMEEKSAN